MAENISYTSNIPEYAQGAFERLTKNAEALAGAGYQPYTGERSAQFSPLQLQAFAAAQNQQVAPQIGQASAISQEAAMRSLGQQYTPNQFYSQQIAPGQIGYQNVNARDIGFERVNANQVGTQGFTAPGAAQAYMSPYMQNVVDVQQREAQRQGDIARTQRGAQAVGSGAFGGSRQAIMEAEAARNLSQQQGDIQSQGLQSAYQQAQQMFTSDQARALQAQQSNQQFGLQAGQSNQQAGLTAGQAGLGAYMQAQQLNQQAGLQAGQSNLQAMMQAQQYNQQSGLEAQRLGEQSRQFGAGFGQQNVQNALAGANQLGNLGQLDYGQQMGIMSQKASLGNAQQQQVQNMLNNDYNAFQQAQNYPYQQAGFLSDILRGTKDTSRSMYENTTQQQPSTLQNLVGLGSAAAGLSKMMAKGGSVRSAGLAELALSRMKG